MPVYRSVKSVFNMVTVAGNHNALFLDLDGTLIDFAARPEDVRIPADLEAVITSLSQKFQGAVAIITGRDMAFIDQAFPHLKPAAAASHGAVIRYQNQGRIIKRVPDFDVEELHQLLCDALTQQPQFVRSGMWVEKKDFACAIHWRQNKLSDRQCEELAQKVAENITGQANNKREEKTQLAMTRGDKVIEIGPAHASKGQVIDLFMQQAPFKGRRPVFLEDSEAGISGMEVVKRLRGLAIGIGPDTAKSADALLEKPENARQLLRALVHNKI